DWLEIFHSKISPNEIAIPESIHKLVKDKNFSIDDIIRMSISCILNPGNSFYWINRINSNIEFDEVLDFFYKVSIRSAKKYIAIHLMDKIDDVLLSKKLENAIRLTVHVKKDRPDIPAISLLGNGYENKLSQHISTLLLKNNLIFKTKLEIVLENNSIKQVFIENPKKFYWLSYQPLMYVSDDDFLQNIYNIQLV
ncbi:hypothetical protein BMT54_12260, partial [Pasteurellaceae bacterium 15-036681]